MDKIFISTSKNDDKFFNCLNIKEALDKSFINIIFEADIFWKGSPIVTEKVWRCIESEVPFIILTHKGLLKYLRGQGFRTFNDIIDESYDEIDDDMTRVKTVFEKILSYLNLIMSYLS